MRRGSGRRSARAAGSPSYRGRLVPSPCLQSDSPTSAERWCRARWRPRGALTRARHSCWREAHQDWAASAQRAARPTGARRGPGAGRPQSGSSAASVATAMARSTASGAQVRNGLRRYASAPPRRRVVGSGGAGYGRRDTNVRRVSATGSRVITVIARRPPDRWVTTASEHRQARHARLVRSGSELPRASAWCGPPPLALFVRRDSRTTGPAASASASTRQRGAGRPPARGAVGTRPRQQSLERAGRCRVHAQR
jgi:hypothetical protein